MKHGEVAGSVGTNFGNGSTPSVAQSASPGPNDMGVAGASDTRGGAAGSGTAAMTMPPSAGAMGAAGAMASVPGGAASGSAGATSPSNAFDSCAALRMPVQLGLHLVVDESASMIYPNDLWSPLGGALGNFFGSDQAARMQVGVEFFQGACDPGSYATPSLPIAPAATQQTALGAAMGARTHGPGAATGLALAGALDQARQWSTSSQGQAAVLLISGSEPSACLGSAAAAASTAAGGLATSPAVPTYVVALRGLASLDRIAQAGGTGQAVVVSEPTMQQALLEAMQVAATQASCQYALPDAATPYLPDAVNVQLTAGATSTSVTRVPNPQACDPSTGGWYYDDAQNPKRIITCDATCKRVAQGGSVELVFGCASVVAP